jgi:hypothetical protein
VLLGEIIYVYGNNNREQNHVPCAQNGAINTCNMWYYCGLDGAVLEDSLIKLSIKTCGKQTKITIIPFFSIPVVITLSFNVQF